MKNIKLSIGLIFSLAAELFAQNTASHQVIINIIRPNSVTVSSFSASSAPTNQSVDAAPVSLLEWSADNQPKKITLSTIEDQSVGVETASQNGGGSVTLSVSDVEQNLSSASPQGSGHCLLKWKSENDTPGNIPIQVAMTVIEI
jgi:hypothetical protein